MSRRPAFGVHRQSCRSRLRRYLVSRTIRFSTRSVRHHLVYRTRMLRRFDSAMNEMNELARALLERKSFKERQECLSNMLDYLSFDYPDLYFLLYKEIKRRERESNDQNKINKWLHSNAQSNLYVKLHEALMLVKSHNIIAKEEYVETIRKMLCQTIENGTNIEIAKKICCLIVNSPHLNNIYKCLVYYIQQVKQLIENNSYAKTSTQDMWNDNFNFKQPNVNASKRFNARYDAPIQPQQHIASVWPPMPQSNNLITVRDIPHISFECIGYERLEMNATANRHSKFDVSQMFSNLTIVEQEMDEVIGKWLHYLKLHKYQWFFNGLSYLEIEFIDEDNIDAFISKVNRNAITKGAQKKICISTSTLRGRKQKFQDILMSLDLEVTPYELCEIFTYMRDILHYPIPNRNCVVGDQLQQDIVLIMEKSLNQLKEKLDDTRYLESSSLLGTSINKYLECILLITGNQIFMKGQIDKIVIFDKILKYKVHKMPKNFN